MSGAVVLATRNAGKVRELGPLFAAAGWELVSLAAVGLGEELPEEDGLESFATFEENALAKARFFSRRLGGRACVADDSGLEVAALGGRPGVRSRRWAADQGAPSEGGEDAANNRCLVRAMDGIDRRDARFVCAAAYCAGARELVVRGEVAGVITREPRGVGGFGYDPYFEATELALTLAEASLDEKGRVSHRARAFRALIARLAAGD